MVSLRGKVCRLALILATTSLGGGCSTLHLKNPEREASTAKVSVQLADAAYLAPFDAQLKRLDDLDAREDRARAAYWIAVRDEHFTAILTEAEAAVAKAEADAAAAAMAKVRDRDRKAKDRAARDSAARSLKARDKNAKAARTQQIAAQVDERWQALVWPAAAGPAPPPSAADLRLVANIESEVALVAGDGAVDRMVLEAARAQFEDRRPETDKRKTDCKALGGPASGEDLADQAYQMITSSCARVAQAEADRNKPLAPLLNGGLISATLQETQLAKDKASGENSPDALAELTRQIKAAEDLAKTGAVADAAALRAKFSALLDAADPIVARLGWEKIGKEIDKLAQAELCAPGKDKVEAALWTEAQCDTALAADSSGSKDKAVWTLVEAVAGLGDANSPEYRSAAWLAAAKAVVAAREADAKLKAVASKQVADAASLRLKLLLREASNLAGVKLAIAGRSGPLCKTPGYGCVYIQYLASWNEGRVPLGVAAYRGVQAERRMTVLRARIVATRRAEMIRAAVQQQMEYGASGLDPKLLGGLTYDAAVLFGLLEH